MIKYLIVGDLQTNCYFLVSNNEMIIIDPGGEAEKILKEIKKIGAKVKYIINTHYHFDHTGANKEIKERTGSMILIHKQEEKFVNFKVNRFLEDNEEIKIGQIILKVIHTPGHTLGSICLLGVGFVFSGDTLFKNGYGRTDLAGGSDRNLKKSLERLSAILKPGTIVYPGHGEIFQI